MPPPFVKFLLSPLAVVIATVVVFSAPPLRAQTARDRAVELNAVAQETPPKITLGWNTASYPVLSQKVFRRLKGGAAWVQIATPANGAITYEDTAVTAGETYEYRVSRTLNGGPGTAEGYLFAGIRARLQAERGRVILLVDNTMAAPLATELTRLESDLTGDGWIVVRQDVSRTALPPAVRATIQSIRAADPANTVAVILVGHIPVPYSGDIAIDGHPDHFGAWPTDVYYGDVDGTWTDATVNTNLDTNAEPPRNTNVPGDGKFDQTVIPSDIELQIGRIDLANMPAFPVSETELLRRYLDRDHNYRHKLGVFGSVVTRGLVDDHFGYFNGEAFAVTAWRSFSACVGSGNVASLDWFGTLSTQSYLWAYGCGAGSYTSAGGVGTTSNFATTTSLAVFNVFFGSYFGDWDISNNFLRAPLAGTAASLGLVSCWAGRPHWYFHPMALGETAGYAARLTQNNSTASGNGYEANVGERFNHIALLGDPTLRLYPVTPPSNLNAVAGAQTVTLNWSAPADGPLEGYVISRASSPGGPYVRLQSALPATTSFVDRSVAPGASYNYLVRAVKFETSPAGTYLNPSQGVFSAAVTAPAASGPEVDLSWNGSPIAADDTATMPSNGTDFGSAETVSSVTRTFVIANLGPTVLTISGYAITGANPGDFTIVNPPPASVAAGTNVSFQIQFHPTTTGARAATFTLASDDADEGSYAFAIGGVGTPPHAEITIYPPAVNRSIHPGDTAVETLNVSDPGPGPLVHTIASSLARYSAIDSDTFGGPAYDWVEISTTGTAITALNNTDDAISPVITLPFSFPFYGASFTSLRVCSNGFLSFTSSSASPSNAGLPSLGAPPNLLALLWTDLQLDGTSRVYHQSIGGNFVVQYENLHLFGNTNVRVTCEAILKPTGEIVFQYKTLTNLGSNHTIGIQNAARDDGLTVSHNVLYAHSAMAIRIRPPGLESWLSLDANSGTVPPGGSQPISATLNATGLAPGNYSAELTVNSNAQGNSTVVIPVRLTVGNTPVENWRLTHFGTTAGTGLAADTADVDGDSRINLLEYAFVTDPQGAEPSGLPIHSTNLAGYRQIQFNRDTTRTDLRYVVEATSDLDAGWSAIAIGIRGAPVIATGAHSAIETGAGNVKTVTVEDAAPAASFTTRYLRLRVLRD